MAIAEGVETEDQYDRLLALDPPFAQGYLFSGPVAEADVPELLAHLGVHSGGGWPALPAGRSD